MSFASLCQVAAYARLQLDLDATKAQVMYGTCRQHPVPCPSRAKDLAPSFQSPPDSRSLFTHSHPATIDISQGLVIKIPKRKTKERPGQLYVCEDERIKILRAEPLIGKFMPDRVWCKECEGWIGLDRRRRYYLGMWKRHVKLYHLPVSFDLD